MIDSGSPNIRDAAKEELDKVAVDALYIARDAGSVMDSAARAVLDALLAPEHRDALLAAMGGEQEAWRVGNCLLALKSYNGPDGVPLWRFPSGENGADK